MNAPQSIPDGLPMPRRLGAILAVAFGVGLAVLDGAVANVALPTIGARLDISAADSVWIVNAYQLAVMVSLLSFSALGETIGYRRIYVAGLALFTLASAGCAAAGSFAGLVAARVVQGFGAAAVTSVNTTLIRIIYPRAQLGRGMGLNATVVAVSSVAGPSVAAAILSVAEWPWLFAVNIPVGIVAVALSRRFLPQNPVRTTGRRFRWSDAAMNALTFGLLMASVESYSHGVDPRLAAAGIALFVAVGLLFVRGQLRRPFPMLPFDLLRKPLFSVSVATSVCSYFGQMLAMVALPFYLQHTCGYDAVTTGLLLTAWPAVIVVAAPTAGLLTERLHAGALGGCGLSPHGRGALSAGDAARGRCGGRHRVAADALRCRLRAVPVAQQQPAHRLGAARAERQRERHARHGPSAGADRGRRDDGPAVSSRARAQYPGRTVAGRRHGARRCAVRPFADRPSAARGAATEIDRERTTKKSHAGGFLAWLFELLTRLELVTSLPEKTRGKKFPRSALSLLKEYLLL